MAENNNTIEKKEVEKVEIEKDTLAAILEKLESLESRDKKKDEEIEMLKSISDKARLSKWEEQNKGPLIRTARISFWEGMPILAWSKVKDEVGYRDGRLVVNQIIKLFLDDGGKKPVTKEVEYLFWAQNVQSEVGEVIKKSESATGQTWTIQLKDGRVLELDIRFLNAF